MTTVTAKNPAPGGLQSYAQRRSNDECGNNAQSNRQGKSPTRWRRHRLNLAVRGRWPGLRPRRQPAKAEILSAAIFPMACFGSLPKQVCPDSNCANEKL